MNKMLYGTAWKEERTEMLVSQALEAGFRSIDTANQRKHYFEEAVGGSLKKWFSSGKLKREELFLQTKFTYINGQDSRLPYDPTASVTEQVRQSFASSCEHLGVEYLDAYLIHGPDGDENLSSTDWAVWKVMEELVDQGKILKIGISNVCPYQVHELMLGARIKPSFVQNRCYPAIHWDAEVRKICKKNSILYQAFSLVRSEWLNAADLAKIAKANAATPAQILYAFARQLGMIPMTGTTNPTHMAEALASVKITLSDAELKILERL